MQPTAKIRRLKIKRFKLRLNAQDLKRRCHGETLEPYIDISKIRCCN